LQGGAPGCALILAAAMGNNRVPGARTAPDDHRRICESVQFASSSHPTALIASSGAGCAMIPERVPGFVPHPSLLGSHPRGLGSCTRDVGSRWLRPVARYRKNADRSALVGAGGARSTGRIEGSKLGLGYQPDRETLACKRESESVG
jgi:hypothetical protein